MAVVVALLWVLELVDTITAHALDGLGIRPRSLTSLGSILAAPLLNFGWQHLASNSVPLFVLGMIIIASGWREFWVSLVCATLGSGLLVWLIAPSGSITAGASGVVFGWLVFVLLRGLFNRRIGQVLVALVVLAIYGGVLWGMLPGQLGISWQGHLGGAIGGAVAAWLLRPSGAARWRF